jgi:hypothetical protein
MINFIGIGATKAGTTWLFDRLRDLNQFRLTPIKELHYFDRDKHYYMSPMTVQTTKFKDRVFFDWRWYKRFSKDIGRTIFQYPSFYDLKWVLKWHTLNYSDPAYAAMFPKTDTKISGEITPAYSFLKSQDISRMFSINNDLKIIFLLRDPIERAWSHIRYRKPSVLQSFEEIKNFIDSEEQVLRGNYIKTMKEYSSIFPKENILICFYDAIIKKPQELLYETVVFLNGDANAVIDLDTLNKKSNVSKALKMPSDVYDYLKNKYKKDISSMASVIGGYPKVWLKKHYGISYTNIEIKNSQQLNTFSVSDL